MKKLLQKILMDIDQGQWYVWIGWLTSQYLGVKREIYGEYWAPITRLITQAIRDWARTGDVDNSIDCLRKAAVTYELWIRNTNQPRSSFFDDAELWINSARRYLE
jgi:hypothetical protein